MLQSFKRRILREPRRGLARSAGMGSGVAQVVFGGLIVAPSFFGPSLGARPFYFSFELLLGLALVLQGFAELLPTERRILAGWLRLGSMVLALLAILTAVSRLVG